LDLGEKLVNSSQLLIPPDMRPASNKPTN